MLFPGAWYVAMDTKQALRKYSRVSGEEQAKQLWGSQDQKVALLTGSTKSREREESVIVHSQTDKKPLSVPLPSPARHGWPGSHNRNKARGALNNVKCGLAMVAHAFKS